jgi:hypothetical protein
MTAVLQPNDLQLGVQEQEFPPIVVVWRRWNVLASSAT